ncbi:MAG: hypothetical protein LC122_06785 [Chitinophagales bacterium]|nr:hypothetical protein [Chitinophagales bacterium]
MTNNKKIQFENFIWVDITNPNKEELLDIAKTYQLDIYQIKDSLELGHLPKFEKTNLYNFLILRGFTAKISSRATTINEISNKIAFFYSDKQVITVHRTLFSFLEFEKNDFKNAEQLVLYIMQKLILTFEEPSKYLSEIIDETEKIIFLKNLSKVSLEELYFHKSQARITKKLLQISQNTINLLEVKEDNQSALQDVKDKILSLILTYDEVSEDSINLLNTYLSVNTQKSNDVMKLLTIFSAFFLPLTFIAGIYGMNFENMPELSWKLGYFLALGVMVIVALIIYVWFKRKKIM